MRSNDIMSKTILLFTIACILAISWAQNAEAEPSAACVTHLTQDAETTECSQAAAACEP